ncbi:MAG: type II toxin-antitoxin system HipA family toxin [Puniceicoccaceae bacterium]|nr:type II toxin-antitoxin system HipA family toxin [Puniceicoccaceae bacterium]
MAAKDQFLHLYLNETPMGLLRRGPGGKLSFEYDAAYLGEAGAVPLSLSMPLVARQYTHETIHPWLWGLLPDNELVLARWGQRFQVSSTNCFGLLECMGEDCAGAIRFIQPEDLDKVASGGKKLLKESDIEERLEALRKDPSLSREPSDRGQFSLAGAQSKTALQRRGSKWYLPWGREPTTHILKPPRPDIDGHVENEHFCLRLAAELGLSVARSEVMHFGKEAAIVVERYDRLMMDRKLIRVHQEDACQALGIHPSLKYQSEGGPDTVKIMELMNRSSQPVVDRRRIMQALVFNYLILGTDAHAKNYSLLLGRNQQVRLARLYDIASFLPYVALRKDCRFAMKIGSYYKDAQIQSRHFEKTARACEFPAHEMRRLICEMASALPDLALGVHREMEQQGITHPVLDQLTELLGQRSARIYRTFKSQ